MTESVDEKPKERESLEVDIKSALNDILACFTIDEESGAWRMTEDGAPEINNREDYKEALEKLVKTLMQDNNLSQRKKQALRDLLDRGERKYHELHAACVEAKRRIGRARIEAGKKEKKKTTISIIITIISVVKKIKEITDKPKKNQQG